MYYYYLTVIVVNVLISFTTLSEMTYKVSVTLHNYCTGFKGTPVQGKEKSCVQRQQRRPLFRERSFLCVKPFVPQDSSALALRKGELVKGLLKTVFGCTALTF